MRRPATASSRIAGTGRPEGSTFMAPSFIWERGAWGKLAGASLAPALTCPSAEGPPCRIFERSVAHDSTPAPPPVGSGPRPPRQPEPRPARDGAGGDRAVQP